jgi:molybdopterin synthase catalytic subunit
MIALTDDPIDCPAVAASVTHSGAGAVVVFEGVVRDRNLGRSVAYLEYEAYPEMAIPEMERITAVVVRRWPGARVAIVHRMGRVEIGEVCVVVAASSAHRAEAFEACRHAIDSLKDSVRIWKKEVWADGEEWVSSPGPPP